MSEIDSQGMAAFRTAFKVAPDVVEGDSRHGLGVCHWKTPPITEFQLPETEELIIALHLGGSRRVREITDTGLSRTVSMPGLVTILPPQRRSAFRTDGAVSLATLHLPARLAGPGTDDGAPWPAQRFAFRDEFLTAGIQALLRAAQAERRPPQAYFSRMIDALACHLAYSETAVVPCLAPAGARAVGALPLDQILDYVERHLGDRLTLDSLATRAGLSRAHFARTFKAAMGISVHQHINQRRVQLARRLLRSSGLDLADIAQETGFSSQSHFTGVFKALQGCTPGHFRSGTGPD